MITAAARHNTNYRAWGSWVAYLEGGYASMAAAPGSVYLGRVYVLQGDSFWS